MDLTTFTDRDRARVLELCTGHEVAYCERCNVTRCFTELGALVTDPETGEPLGCDQYEPGNYCPGCGADLTQSVLAHLEEAHPEAPRTATLTAITRRWPDSFAWLRRQSLFHDDDWDMSTPFAVLREGADGHAVYVSDDDSVVEIHTQSEPHIVPCDPEYAAMVRRREGALT